MGGLLGVAPVDRGDLLQGTVLVVGARRTRLARDHVALAQAETADELGADEAVVLAGEVAARAQEAVAVGHDVQHARGVFEALGPNGRLEDRIDELGLLHARAVKPKLRRLGPELRHLQLRQLVLVDAGQHLALLAAVVAPVLLARVSLGGLGALVAVALLEPAVAVLALLLLAPLLLLGLAALALAPLRPVARTGPGPGAAPSRSCGARGPGCAGSRLRDAPAPPRGLQRPPRKRQAVPRRPSADVRAGAWERRPRPPRAPKRPPACRKRPRGAQAARRHQPCGDGRACAWGARSRLGTLPSHPSRRPQPMRGRGACGRACPGARSRPRCSLLLRSCVLNFLPILHERIQTAVGQRMLHALLQGREGHRGDIRPHERRLGHMVGAAHGRGDRSRSAGRPPCCR